MKIRTLTWNIGGGKFLAEGADPSLMASYKVDGIHEIIEYLQSENLDIITLQETQSGKSYDQVKQIAEILGYNYVHDSTSDSHIDIDYKLGHAILTKHSIISHITGLFKNPNVETEWEDGTIAKSFNKGYSTCILDLGGQELSVTTLHLMPFRKFNIALDSGVAAEVLANVQVSIDTSADNWIMQGDFNINTDRIRDYLPGLFSDTTDEILLTEPTTPKNRKYDHIIFNNLNLIRFKVDPNVKTDHYPIIAEFNL